MAPNKKKKKPATASNRGFATVSVASRKKAEDDSSPSRTPQEDIQKTSTPQSEGSIVKGQHDQTAETPNLQQLSPEELEAHLEDSELQALVDQHCSTVKRNASRVSSKLLTERRLLRLQSSPLAISRWISDEDTKLILDLATEGISDSKPVATSGNDPRHLSPQDDICLQLWELGLVLQDLGIDDANLELVTRAMGLRYNSRAIAATSGNKGNSWLVEAALDWLALHAPPSELPSYDKRLVRSESPKTEDATTSLTVPNIENPESDALASGRATPKSDHEVSNTPSRSEVVSSTGSQPSITGSDSDSDLEPEELQSRYIDARSQLYDIQPELFNPKTAELEAPGKIGHVIVSDKNNHTIQRLRRLLQKIESDVLFDRQEAAHQWKLRMANLAKTRSQSRRTSRVPAKSNTVSCEELRHDHDCSTPELDGEDEEDNLFGAMFADKEGELITENGLQTSNSTIILKDFGTWSGIGPRRVLEEACKARDPGSKVSCMPISSSGYANRYSLVIRWTKSQDTHNPITLTTVACSLAPKQSSFTMESIVTPTSSQSEAYVSTIALFVIFSASAKEEKSHLRLPAVWRELWSELVTLKKIREDEKAKQTLRNLKDILNSKAEAALEDGSDLLKGQNTSNIGNGNEHVSKKLEQFSAHDPEALKAGWRLKSSSPKYQRMLSTRSALPIWEFKEQILKTFADHQAVIICGETGCGKSTQIPSFILEEQMLSGRECRIWITEPRRISAISLAQRVSEELGEFKDDLGSRQSDVGYAIRLESKINDRSRIVYATTGVVVRMLERPDDLYNITHLVLDEVHERSIDSDFLLIVLRRLMDKRPDLKVVLMSATLDAQRFSNYLGGAPVFNVPGRTFPVETKYLEDAIEATRYSLEDYQRSNNLDGDAAEFSSDDESEKGPVRPPDQSVAVDGEYSKTTKQVLKTFDEYRINYDLIVRVLNRIATSPDLGQYSKAILVFLPGLFEMRRLAERITSHSTFSKGWIIHLLHSTVASEEQEKAFLTPPRGTRKIVIATNIAETGITIPDITAVVDSGKEKVMRFDERRQLSRLVESFISRANAKQRRGRAGRVQSGICFHLFSRYRHDRLLSEQQTPEMLRLSLQDLVLRVKTCNLGGIEQTLSEALDPPSSKNVRRSIEALKEVKALTNAEELTPLGTQLARLPLDVFLGKLVLNGLFFQCLDAVLTIAAIMSSKSPFASSSPKSQVELARLSFQRGDSDLLTLYNVYNAWRRIRVSGNMSEYQFCTKNCLSPKALTNIEDLKVSLCVSLVDAGLLTLDPAGHASLKRARWNVSRQRHFFSVPEHVSKNNENDFIIRSVIAWSFYPKLLLREGRGWRNVANNQPISISPASLNKTADSHIKWLSFYSILQSSNKYYNANETSAVDELAIALLCGDVEFKVYAGVLCIDGNRIRFSFKDWKSMIALKFLSLQIREILNKSFKNPKRRSLTARELKWFGIWERIFSSGKVGTGDETSSSQAPS